MKAWAIWHGGAGYGPSSIPEHVELFRSVTAAKEALEDRYASNGRRPVEFAYVNKAEDYTLVPCVETDSEMWLYFSDPSDSSDPYPDRIVRLSRNGRAYVEPA